MFEKIFEKIHIIMAFVVCLIGCVFILCSCGNKDESLRDFTVKFASEYKVVHTKNENYCVSVTAPDFQKIATLMVAESEDNKVDSNLIIDYAEKHPEYKKDYILNVDECSDDVIHKKLLDQISYDLMVVAIQNNEFSERWDTE